jgi:hypothetical protein
MNDERGRRTHPFREIRRRDWEHRRERHHVDERALDVEHRRQALYDVTGAYRPDVWREGIAALRNMKTGIVPYILGFGGGGPDSGALLGALWTQIGPAPIRNGAQSYAGRVLDIAIDPSGTTDKNVYIATWGGIWKSTDGGSTWAPKTDRLTSIAMGAVGIDPNNPSVLYAGAINNPPGPCPATIRHSTRPGRSGAAKATRIRTPRAGAERGSPKLIAGRPTHEGEVDQAA